MKLMILGATGAVGSRVLEQALASEHFETIVAPTRRPLADPRRVHNPVIPFTLPLPRANWWAVDGVICCLGTTLKQAGSKTGFYGVDHDLVVACAGMAREAGTCAFALNSSLGASPKSLSFYLKTKGKTESVIAGMDFQRFVIVRPSLIDAEREQSRFGESLGLMAGRLLSPITPRRYRPVSADAIAATLLREMEGPAGDIVVESEDISRCAT